jgi:hypothetical protein
MTKKYKRKAISKKLRFEVFKRDEFKCVYCGRKPPAVILNIDHIAPVSKGGTNDINNLVTACFDCNNGKSAIPLDIIPGKLSDNMEMMREKELQIKAYRAFIRKIRKRINKDIEDIETIYSDYFQGCVLYDNFKANGLKKFVLELPKDEIEDAMTYSCNKINDSERALTFFCKICWNKIKGRNYS